MQLRGKGMLKALWIEDLDNNQARVFQHIKTTGAKTICVRTTASSLKGLLPTFQGQMGLKVYGWRWPHLVADPNATPIDPAHPDPTKDDAAYWPNEMARALDLIKVGLDGYIFDIESDDGIHDPDNKYQPYPKDWDNPNVHDRATPAHNFAKGVSDAFIGRRTPYVLGLTSHQIGFTNYPGIPWQSFLDFCNVLYPQTYWRFRNNAGRCQDEASPINDPTHPTGKPEQAVLNGYADYANKKDAQGKVISIIPVAGEVGCITADEVKRFMKAIAPHKPLEAHFYVDVDDTFEAIGAQ
jgi:hypothetical protein